MLKFSLKWFEVSFTFKFKFLQKRKLNVCNQYDLYILILQFIWTNRFVLYKWNFVLSQSSLTQMFIWTGINIDTGFHENYTSSRTTSVRIYVFPNKLAWIGIVLTGNFKKLFLSWHDKTSVFSIRTVKRNTILHYYFNCYFFI